jgi:D-alanyl-lipoteichoic acid acyltransferase DltB (MBOAT superfamily)
VLAWYGVRVAALAGATALALWALLHRTTRAAVAAGLAALAALFVANKLAGGAATALPAQSGVALLGTSFLVLKAAAVLLDARQAPGPRPPLRDLAAFFAFLPPFPAGPIEEFDHFRNQHPVFERGRLLAGLERILLGLAKSLVGAHQLGLWAAPILAAPDAFAPPWLLLALYACSLQVYLDFSGYSDIAIGVSALYARRLRELRPSLDAPQPRQFWQRWRALTRWLRAYVFVPRPRGARAGTSSRRPPGGSWP